MTLQYTEIFKVVKKIKIFSRICLYFSYFCSKHTCRLWVHVFQIILAQVLVFNMVNSGMFFDAIYSELFKYDVPRGAKPRLLWRQFLFSLRKMY